MPRLLGLLGSALLALVALPSRAITIAVHPSTQTVAMGSSLEVSLVVSDLGDGVAPSLSSFDLDVTFDGGVLDFVGATFGDPVLGDQLDLGGFGSASGATPGPGVVDLFEISLDLPDDLDDLQAGSFALATLAFDAVGLGTSALGISIRVLGDAAGDPLTAEAAGGSVTSVPEPAPLLLVLSGMVALGRWRGGRGRRVGRRAARPLTA